MRTQSLTKYQMHFDEKVTFQPLIMTKYGSVNYTEFVQLYSNATHFEIFIDFKDFLNMSEISVYYVHVSSRALQYVSSNP